MNDIEILENFLKEEVQRDKLTGDLNLYAFPITYKEVCALENLIKENKKLKNKCRELIKEKQILTTALEEK